MVQHSEKSFALQNEISPKSANMKYRFHILLFTFLIVSACEKPIDWDSNYDVPETIVVEAILTNENKIQEINLSLPFADQNGIPMPVTGAQVRVSNGTVTMPFLEDIDNPGTYLSQLPFACAIQTNYYLEINYNSEIYSAESYTVPVSYSGAIHYEPAASYPGNYQINWTVPTYSQTEQAMFKIDIDWTHLVDSSLIDTITRAIIYQYTFNSIDVGHTLFPQNKEDIYFPPGSIIIGTKYSLTEEYASYLRALIASTEWQGSLFEDARANLPTNISNGGLGFFSACSVISDTIVVQ